MRLSLFSTRVALLGVLTLPVSLRAQASAMLPSGTGFSVAGAVGMTRMQLSNFGSGLEGSSFRPEGQIEVAYGASPRLQLVAAFRPVLGKVGDQKYTINGAELGLRYLGHAGMPLRPFAEGGFGIRTFRYEVTDLFTSTNVSPWASVGVMRLAKSHWSAEAAATWTISTFDNWVVNGQPRVLGAARWTAVGARAGVRYWVRAR